MIINFKTHLIKRIYMKDLSIYEKLYDDCALILKGEKWLDSFVVDKAPTPNDEQLEKLNIYLNQYLNESNCGILKTLLIISKPFKNNPIVSETISELLKRYKSNQNKQ
jgi:hypothetical protein